MNQRNNYLDIAKELGERAGSKIYQVREPSRGLHNNMSPVGTMLAKGFKGLHHYAMNGGTGNQNPFQRDMRIARREKGRKIKNLKKGRYCEISSRSLNITQRASFACSFFLQIPTFSPSPVHSCYFRFFLFTFSYNFS